MADDVEWVLLVECYNMAELFTLRSMLEANGLPCRVHGEHAHGVFGPIQGAMARSRILVPRSVLGRARELAEDIVGPFDEIPEDDEEDEPGSPFRRPAEAEAPGDDAPPTVAALRPKSYAALVLVVAIFGIGPFFGLSHIYIGRNGIAGALAVTSIFAIAAVRGGALWAAPLLAVVWVIDLVGGALGIAEHNRKVAAQAALAEAAEQQAELAPASDAEPPGDGVDGSGERDDPEDGSADAPA